MGHIDGLTVDGDGEGGGTHFWRDGCGLNAGGCVCGDGKREKANEERAKNRQEARPRRESENETTLAPEGQGSKGSRSASQQVSDSLHRGIMRTCKNDGSICLEKEPESLAIRLRTERPVN
jgi:hypothetical protein